MASEQEKRNETRKKTYKKVYQNENLIGFLINVSHGGMKLWLGKDKFLEVQDELSILIPLSENKSCSETIPFDLSVVWKNPDRSSLLYEVGCQFQDLSPKQREQLTALLYLS